MFAATIQVEGGAKGPDAEVKRSVRLCGRGETAACWSSSGVERQAFGPRLSRAPSLVSPARVPCASPLRNFGSPHTQVRCLEVRGTMHYQCIMRVMSMFVWMKMEA